MSVASNGSAKKSKDKKLKKRDGKSRLHTSDDSSEDELVKMLKRRKKKKQQKERDPEKRKRQSDRWFADQMASRGALI